MFHVHRSNRLERLVDALVAEMLANPLGSPFAAEWVAVQSLGVRAYLEREIANRVGVFANTVMPFPSDLVLQIAQWCGEGADGTDGMVPSSEGSLAFAVLEELPRLFEHPRFSPVKSYVARDRGGRAVYELSRKVAHAFSEYSLYRPQMLTAWETPSPADGWQPILFRAAMARIGSGAERPAASHSGLARLAIDRLSRGDVGELPQRISLFGFSSLPPLYLDVLAALAGRVDVHLYALSPSREYYGDVDRGGNDNALIASLGRLGRDFQNIIEERVDYVEPAGELYEDPMGVGAGTLLATIQSDLLHLRRRVASAVAACPPVTVAADDWSLKVCACRGRLREIEAVRGELLAILGSPESGLRPEQIAVLAPDIAEYAPFIEAVFSGAPTGTGPSSAAIPYVLTRAKGDPSGALLGTAVSLLDLTQARLTAAEVFDFLARPAVRRRFGVSPEEVDQLREAAVQAGARFGIDAAHRGRLGLPALGENTWRFALDRMLLGLALSSGECSGWRGVLPWDVGVGADEGAVARAVECLESILGTVQALGAPRTLAQWCAELRRAVAKVCDLAGEDPSAREALEDAIAAIGEDAEAAGSTHSIEPAVMAAELGARAHENETRRLSLDGVVCADLSQMRGVPFRVVCVVGLDDKSFPRVGSAPSFDLMASEPRAGDRSPRDDDKAIFLETILAARERLILTFPGDGEPRQAAQASIVVGALMDVVEEGFGAKAERFVVQHPVEPFSASYFLPDSLRRARLPSFDDVAYAASAAAMGASGDGSARAWHAERLPREPGELRTVELDDLVRFFGDPSRYFCERVLGVRVPSEGDELPDREPFELGHLARYDAGARALGDILGGEDVERSYARAAGAGRIPIGPAGRLEHQAVAEAALEIAKAVREAAGGEAAAPMESVWFEEELDEEIGEEIGEEIRTGWGACTVRGQIDGLIPGGRIIVDFGKANGRRLLAAWIPHLALNCLVPEGGATTTLCLGAMDGGRPIVLPAVPDAREHLARLVLIYRRGQSAPLPLFPETSYAYVEDLRKRRKKNAPSAEARDAAALEKALVKWDGGDYVGASPGECERPAARLVWGGALPWEIAGVGPLGFRELAVAVFDPIAALVGDAERTR